MSMPTEPERAVGPANCAFLVGLPVTEGAFHQHLGRDEGYVVDMAREQGWTTRTQGAAWSLYSNMAAPIRAASRRTAELGVTVVMDAELADLGACCAELRVVTLFTHCDTSDPEQASVELSHGLVPLSRVVDAIPPTFSGVLELALCRSWRLGEMIKSRRPGCLVVMHERETRPAFRAPFYRAVIEELALRPRRYTDAVIDLAKELLR